MNSGELKRLLAAAQLSQASFARLIAVTPRAVNMWVRDERKVPGPVAAYLHLYCHIHSFKAQEAKSC